MTMEAAVLETFTKIKLLKPYRPRSLAPEQQDWLRLICDRFSDALSEEREKSIPWLPPEIPFYFSLFFMYGKTMAVEAVRDHDEAKIFKGLVALAAENQVFDWRDSLMVLTLLYHSAIKIGADAPDLYRRVAAISTSQTADSYLQCLASTPEQRDIVKFGFKEGTDLDGNFTYVAKMIASSKTRSNQASLLWNALDTG
ncbi:MAG TPA: hypothetical protein VIW93_15685 [Candidatus Acidoferrum sp.]